MAAGPSVGAAGAELGPRVAVGAVPDAGMHERATWLYTKDAAHAPSSRGCPPILACSGGDTAR